MTAIRKSRVGESGFGSRAGPTTADREPFRAAFARDKNTQVVLKADKGVQHGRVVNLMERAKQVGLRPMVAKVVERLPYQHRALLPRSILAQQ